MDVLKVNVMVSNGDGGFHVDRLDLYAARARTVFVQQVAMELGIAEGVLKLETLQHEAITQALAPKETPASPA